jgi:hypothetical protein
MSIGSGFPEPQNTAMGNGVESTKSRHMPKMGYTGCPSQDFRA